jgi:hypothetical protein
VCIGCEPLLFATTRTLRRSVLDHTPMTGWSLLWVSSSVGTFSAIECPQIYNWGRVVKITGPEPISAVLAPIDDEWAVIGVQRTTSAPS